jgi:hypothetical protein
MILIFINGKKVASKINAFKGKGHMTVMLALETEAGRSLVCDLPGLFSDTMPPQNIKEKIKEGKKKGREGGKEGGKGNDT